MKFQIGQIIYHNIYEVCEVKINLKNKTLQIKKEEN